jgi:hypothetical protein
VFWTRKQNGNYAVAVSTHDPMARSEDLIVQEVDNEVLVYDEVYARAHCLSADAARVWRACDGQTSESGLQEKLGLSAETVVRALAELEEKELLAAGPDEGEGATRREFGLKAAKMGAVAAAAPMIFSIVAPTPAAAATPTEAQCNYYSGKSCDACQGICGCCCCCQGCSKTTNSPACKMCSAIRTCPTHTKGCADQLAALGGDAGQTCSSGPGCSATAKPGMCSPPCTGGVPSDDCRSHDCNCFGIAGNPCAGT